MFIIQAILRKIFKIKGGLEILPKDIRDDKYAFGRFFGTEYRPKHAEFEFKPFTIKSQRFNTCGWVASTGAKEIDEQVELDERSTVIFGRKEGYISSDGFSNLRNNEKIVQKYGIAEKGILKQDNGSWDDYSNANHITPALLASAAKHKTKSYSTIYTIGEIYQAIDEKRPVKIGIGWRSSMNMGNGFSFPWLLNFASGWLVGGHAMYLCGYKTLAGKKVFKVVNSFGDDYADNGTCWITEDDLMRDVNNYGAFTNIDAGSDQLEWLSSHQGAVVKSGSAPAVYLIQGDKKRQYDDLATLYAHGKHDQDIVTVDNEIIDNVQAGQPIRFWDGGNVMAIKAIIQQKYQLRPIFEKYFTELFQ